MNDVTTFKDCEVYWWRQTIGGKAWGIYAGGCKLPGPWQPVVVFPSFNKASVFEHNILDQPIFSQLCEVGEWGPRIQEPKD
jgi:hypothetical protein